MAVAVVSVRSDAVVLRAPLAPNINHRETVFGGSASALAILAAWSLLYARLRDEGIASRLVIQRNTMEYARPIPGEFTARSSLDPTMDWARFTRTLARRGKARLTVTAVLEYTEQIAGRFTGDFVALAAQGA